MEERRGRSFDGELRLSATENPYFFDAEVLLLNGLVNRNNWRFENLEAHRAAFAGTPILVAYVNNGTGIGDGHNYREDIDPETGESRPSFTDADAERIVGALSEDPNDIRIEERDGTEWVIGKGRLWRWYAPELTDKIERDAAQGRAMSISIEALVTDWHEDEDGVEVEEKYIPLGTTILGDHVAPAVVGARIAALESMDDAFRELKLRAAAYEEKAAEPEEKEPEERELQAEITKRSVRRPMTKQHFDRLSPLFEGYRVCGTSEDGMTVALMDSNFRGFTYRFLEEDKGEVVKARITPVETEILFRENGEESMDLTGDMGEVMAAHVAAAAQDAETIKNLNAQLEQVRGELEAMRQKEHDARMNAVNSAVERALSDCEAAGFDRDALKECADGIDAEKFAALEEDGTFVGADRARSVIMAACAELQLKAAAKKKQVSMWDIAGAADRSADGESMEDFVNRYTGR